MTINQNLVDSRPTAKGKCFPTPYSSQGDIPSSSMQLAHLVVESLVTSMLNFFLNQTTDIQRQPTFSQPTASIFESLQYRAGM